MTGKARLQNLLLTLPFVVLFLVNLVHHQMWRDEVNAYSLAAASPNFALLFHYIHYEGHPWLWYVLLWLVSRFTTNPLGLKVLQAFVGTAVYLAIGFISPFRWFEKLLLFTSYFVIFEYTVITRMYGVQLLLALIYVWLRTRRPQALAGQATLLGLMACCDISGMALSAGLIAERLWALHESGSPLRKLRTGAIIYVALALSAVLSLLPASDISHITTFHTFHYLKDYNRLGASLVNYLGTPYLATMTLRPGHFWDTTMNVAPKSFGAMVALVLGAYWLTFRQRKGILLLLGVTSVLMITSGFVIYRGSMRHYGVTFVAFVCGLWLLRASGGKLRWPAYALLALTTFAGIHATIGSWQRPFSQAAATAAWLKANHLDHTLIAGVPTAATIGVTEQLGVPIYQLECATPGEITTFYMFTNQCEAYKPSMLSDRLKAASIFANGAKLTLIREDPLTPAEIDSLHAQGLNAQALAGFANAEVSREDFYLYAIEPHK